MEKPYTFAPSKIRVVILIFTDMNGKKLKKYEVRKLVNDLTKPYIDYDWQHFFRDLMKDERVVTALKEGKRILFLWKNGKMEYLVDYKDVYEKYDLILKTERTTKEYRSLICLPVEPMNLINDFPSTLFNVLLCSKEVKQACKNNLPNIRRYLSLRMEQLTSRMMLSYTERDGKDIVFCPYEGHNEYEEWYC